MTHELLDLLVHSGQGPLDSVTPQGPTWPHLTPHDGIKFQQEFWWGLQGTATSDLVSKF
jgi:hypothetical protein